MVHRRLGAPSERVERRVSVFFLSTTTGVSTTSTATTAGCSTGKVSDPASVASSCLSVEAAQTTAEKPCCGSCPPVHLLSPAAAQLGRVLWLSPPLSTGYKPDVNFPKTY
ncbi:unnamed protein product [Caenorhabditis auriculariae]|uniref:Uncharacterized protein n=1 Tax=Caenorhabditis auriculariae TaxID=2777116 RepID=A0A8S1GSJ8_9PELO|nr:unnamed protein product [Caenorhabditis auriculariae]